jgi:hypothetical protein
MISDHDLDPLDRELMERALDSVWEAIKNGEGISDYGSDEELEAALRCELTDVARNKGVEDAETLREVSRTS